MNAADALDTLLRRRPELMPPRRLRRGVGWGDFHAVGDQVLRQLVDVGRLQPDERVLDVGCGVGRVAIPLMGYLNADTSYEGFDIVPEAIDWCQRTITPKAPNFRFRHVNVFNRAYNSKGVIPAEDLTFPYDDQTFDFTFAISLFTHMLPAEVERYLAEIKRTLKYGGRCLITAFLLNEESLRLSQAGKSRLRFDVAGNGYRTVEEGTPETAVAYDDAQFQALLARTGLTIASPIQYGRWCGRADGRWDQDLVLVNRGQAWSRGP